MSFHNRISDDYRPVPPICRRCREPKSMFGVNLMGICWECLRQGRNKRLREPIQAEVREVLKFLPSGGGVSNGMDQHRGAVAGNEREL